MMESGSSKKEQMLWINSTEMDYVTCVEAGYKVPIAFRNRESLVKWIEDSTELKQLPLGRRDLEKDVMLLSGLVKPFSLTNENVGEGLFYNQVWARVDYRQYRGAITFAIKEAEGSYKSLDLYDGDHAVSKKRLAKLWPDAWVNIVLVERGVNRAVGSMLEKEPLNASREDDCITINAESVLKTFYDRGDENMRMVRVREYLAKARQRFISFRNEMSHSNANLELGTEDKLSEFLYSENAWEFFDDFARSLKVDLLDRPSNQMLAFP